MHFTINLSSSNPSNNRHLSFFDDSIEITNHIPFPAWEWKTAERKAESKEQKEEQYERHGQTHRQRAEIKQQQQIQRPEYR